MATFAGWSPCITGRLSFSQIGSIAKHAVVCNRTDANVGGFVFGSVVRTSRDGPLPAWMLRRLGRVPDTLYMFALKVEAGLLPYEREHCDPILPEPCADGTPVDTPAEPRVVLRHDDRALVTGEFLFLSNGPQAQVPAIKAQIASYDKLAAAGRMAAVGPMVDKNYLSEAQSTLASLRNHLVAEARAGRPTPAFGRATVSLWRTGQVRIQVEHEDLFTGTLIKEYQADLGDGGWVPPSQTLAATFDAEAEQRARQLFFTIRDLAHQHYHHDAQSDLLTTAYPWSSGDDEKWRRETQYGLVRMAISLRRRDTAESFKRALGILAYADAFQRHMCGWVEASPDVAKDSPLRFAYDFAALRASIDSSLKVRELKDSQRKQTLLFQFGLCITVLGIVVTGLRGRPGPQDVAYFSNLLRWVTVHPLLSLFFTWWLAWAIDAAFVRLAIKPKMFENFNGGLSRLLDGIMGSAYERFPRVAAYAFAVALALLIFIVGVLGSGLSWYLAMRYIQ